MTDANTQAEHHCDMCDDEEELDCEECDGDGCEECENAGSIPCPYC